MLILERVSVRSEKVILMISYQAMRCLLIRMRVAEWTRLPIGWSVRLNGCYCLVHAVILNEAFAAVLVIGIVVRLVVRPIDAERNFSSSHFIIHDGRRGCRDHLGVFAVVRRCIFHVNGGAALQEAAFALRTRNMVGLHANEIRVRCAQCAA